MSSYYSGGRFTENYTPDTHEEFSFNDGQNARAVIRNLLKEETFKNVCASQIRTAILNSLSLIGEGTIRNLTDDILKVLFSPGEGEVSLSKEIEEPTTSRFEILDL